MAHSSTVPIMLRGGRVTAAFRDAVFHAANRAGMSVNEFVLLSTAQRLQHAGARFDGVFIPGDIGNDNGAAPLSERA